MSQSTFRPGTSSGRDLSEAAREGLRVPRGKNPRYAYENVGGDHEGRIFWYGTPAQATHGPRN